MDLGRVFARVRRRLTPRRFPLRWLSRGPYWHLVKEPLLEQVIAEEGWIAWERARDGLAVLQLMHLASTGALYGDTFAGQPWQARLWADDTLYIAVERGVLTLVDRRAKVSHREVVALRAQISPESWGRAPEAGGA